MSNSREMQEMEEAKRRPPLTAAAVVAAAKCANGNHTVECAHLAATEEEWGGCLAKRDKVYSVGDKVRLLADIWDNGQDHHPPGYLAYKGEVLVVRKVIDGHTASFGVSHEHRTDCYFYVAANEIEPV